MPTPSSAAFSPHTDNGQSSMPLPHALSATVAHMLAWCGQTQSEARFSTRGLVVDTLSDIATQIRAYFPAHIDLRPMLDDLVEAVTRHAEETCHTYQEVRLHHVRDGRLPPDGGQLVLAKWYTSAVTSDSGQNFSGLSKTLKPGWSGGASTSEDLLKHLNIGRQKGFLLTVAASNVANMRAQQAEQNWHPLPAANTQGGTDAAPKVADTAPDSVIAAPKALTTPAPDAVNAGTSIPTPTITVPAGVVSPVSKTAPDTPLARPVGVRADTSLPAARASAPSANGATVVPPPMRTVMPPPLAQKAAVSVPAPHPVANVAPKIAVPMAHSPKAEPPVVARTGPQPVAAPAPRQAKPPRAEAARKLTHTPAPTVTPASAAPVPVPTPQALVAVPKAVVPRAVEATSPVVATTPAVLPPVFENVRVLAQIVGRTLADLPALSPAAPLLQGMLPVLTAPTVTSFTPEGAPSAPLLQAIEHIQAFALTQGAARIIPTPVLQSMHHAATQVILPAPVAPTVTAAPPLPRTPDPVVSIVASGAPDLRPIVVTRPETAPAASITPTATNASEVKADKPAPKQTGCAGCFNKNCGACAAMGDKVSAILKGAVDSTIARQFDVRPAGLRLS